MTTSASRYYEPQRANDVARPIPTLQPTRRATYLERNGEVIAGAIGLVVFGFAVGVVIVGLVVFGALGPTIAW